MVKAAVNQVQAALEAALGEGLVALYRYGVREAPHHGPGRAGDKLLVVVADEVEVDLHRLKDTLAPAWKHADGSLHRTPLIARRTAFRRHLQFYPLLADYLSRHGVRLSGQELFNEILGGGDAMEQAGWLALRTLRASRILAPALISAEQEQADRAELKLVARRLLGAGLPEKMPTALLFGKIQAALHGLVESVPGREPAPAGQTEAAAGKPPVQAVYDELDRVVCILPELSARQWLQSEWDRLGERLQPHQSWIQVTTARQLSLILRTHGALAFVLGRYEHRSGQNPLSYLEVSLRTVWRNAGRLPSRLSIDDVPGAFLMARDADEAHKVVHDYQNRLLNMRLQHELLHRLHGFEPAAPPEPLPGREKPLPVRVGAILNHLGWWAEYYHEQMQRSDLNEKIAAP